MTDWGGTMRHRLAAALVAAVTFSALPGTSASQGAEQPPLRYVAMGDSYSAASGVLPPDPTAPPQCLRSSVNFGHVIAEATGAALTDVSCGAAQTKDYFKPQHDGVAPQLDALRRRTQLVTMTIGGNNNNTFISAILSCGTAGATTLGQGSPCKDRYGDSFAEDIRTKTFPALLRTLRAVHDRAPRAEVAILGYPWILPERVGCFDKMPVARGDVPYLRGIQALLNRVIRRAAERTGTTYVDMNRFSEGHDACQPLGVRWVEPVLQTTNPVVVHPNALGEKKMARKTMRVLGLR
jgi:lysophospholipase L1-like esterase